MLNVFKNEIYKSLTKGKILAYLIFLTLIISVIGVIIKINILILDFLVKNNFDYDEKTYIIE